MAEWTAEELRECTRYGMLWAVMKVRKDGSFGVKRVRRRGEKFYIGGPLLWKRVREQEDARLGIELGDVLFESHDRAVTCLKPPKEVREDILEA